MQPIGDGFSTVGESLPAGAQKRAECPLSLAPDGYFVILLREFQYVSGLT